VIETLQRHDLLRLDPLVWQRTLESRADLSARPHVSDWARRGWPVIVRRALPSELADADRLDLIPVAIALPLPEGKPGVALRLPASGVQQRLPALSLRACCGVAPRSWWPTLQAVLGVGAGLRLEPCVFGSLLWQTLTGMSYLHERSDLDLIWRVSERQQALRLCRALADVGAASALRIDGELLLPDGSSVQWRELLRCPSEVIVKTRSRVECRPWAQLFA
jgi:phosphoribosyl-dephospho-CoA transferase